jgi:enediyne biosynthesis protein E4
LRFEFHQFAGFDADASTLCRASTGVAGNNAGGKRVLDDRRIGIQNLRTHQQTKPGHSEGSLVADTSVPWWKRQARAFAAVALTLAAFAAAYFVEHPVVANVGDLAWQFAFSRRPLPEVPGPAIRQIRTTHPDYRHISLFWSHIGAAAALNDLDGDGLPNDVCYVDTRTDQVIVAPVPGTGDRYKPFALDFNAGPAKLFDRATMAPLGCLPGDLDEDGRIDLIVYFAGRTPVLLLSRPAEGGDNQLSGKNFVPVDIIPGGDLFVTGSATLADLDGDGHLDLVIVNYNRDGSAIFDPNATTPVAMPDSFSRAFNGGGIHIYRCLSQEKNGSRTVGCAEVVDALPRDLPKGWGLAVAACDIDGDLLPELYVANDFGPDRLLWNRSTPGRMRFDVVEGERSLNKASSKAVGRDSFKGMGVDFADLNGDRVPDIFVSNITTKLGFQEGQLVFLSTGSTVDKLAKGVAPYVEAGESLGLARSGWAWDAKLDDFNNDGVLEAVQALGYLKGRTSRWPEMQEAGFMNDRLAASPYYWPSLLLSDDIAGRERNAFYVRAGTRYVNISDKIGFGEDNPSRGIAIADVDGDGKLDMVVANMWGPATYYHNECRQCGDFLGLHLRLPVAKGEVAGTIVRPGHPGKDVAVRPAIGAAVTVTRADGPVLTRQVDGGNGHSGKRSPDLHFGLGANTGPVRVDIRWRDANGHPRHETHQLAPGWHTVVLGSDG